MKIIDTHFHIWNHLERPMPWFEDFKGHFSDVLKLDEYLAAIHGLDIEYSCYQEVDVRKDETLDKEARLAIDLCQDSDQVMAATIGGDLSSENFPEYIKRYAKSPFVKSVRDNFFLGDPAAMESETFVRNTQLLGDLGIMKDLVLHPDKIMTAVRLVERCPKTRFVINHCGFMSPFCEDEKAIELWREGMQRYAAAGNTICKISGLLLHCAEHDWQAEDLRWVVDFTLDLFGEDRIVFASNWPVCNLGGDLPRWISALKEIVSSRSETFQKKLFFDNAMKFYRAEA